MDFKKKIPNIFLYSMSYCTKNTVMNEIEIDYGLQNIVNYANLYEMNIINEIRCS